MTIISPNFFRGHIETIILSILNKQDSYGYEIGKLISEASNQVLTVTETALYNAFRRLEAEELICTYWQDGSNGTRRRYYSISNKGKEILNLRREEWLIGKNCLDKLIGGDFFG